ncbi:MAG TPA: hydantoinase/oxoprolinase family protein [Solirubrobacteraceae bacterium]|jgi:N-methylhydantoinase A
MRDFGEALHGGTAAAHGSNGSGPRYRVGIDIGGTFTDYMAYDMQSGQLSRTKTLSGGSELDATFTAAVAELGVTHESLDLLIHGTTVVTNLVLERNGAEVGLITSAGFRDVLEIGWSFRDDAYDLQWTKFKPLVPRRRRLEVAERVGPGGEIELPLHEQGVRAAAQELLGAGVDAIAICFLHAYANAEHEQAARRIVAEIAPGLPCVISSEVDRRLGEYERVSTTVLSAYATPRLGDYVDGIERWVGPGRTAYFMQSEGGVIPAEVVRRTPTSLVLSGPAAGVLATCHVGRMAGFQNLISMDVGGTSADVCIIRNSEASLREVLEIEPGMPLRTTSLDVAAVGAGGGSIAWIDRGDALRVGPASAGASPGPACYGRGGELPTVTDANVVIGITNAEGLLGGRLKGDAQLAHAALAALGERLGISGEEAALGVYRIVNATMAQAIRTLTVQRGIDPRDFALMSFGGAGGQHAVEVAREMQIPRVVFPQHPSTFSALGLLAADVQTTRTQPAHAPLELTSAADVAPLFADLEAETAAALGDSRAGGEVVFRRFADLRYVGQVHSIRTPTPVWDAARINDDFEDLHETQYGTRLGDALEVVNVGITARLELAKPKLGAGADARTSPSSEPVVLRESFVCLDGVSVPVVDRRSLAPGMTLPAPCLVEEVDSVLYLPSGSAAVVDELMNIVCEVGER